MAIVKLTDKEKTIFDSDGLKSNGCRDDSAVFAALCISGRALDVRGQDDAEYGLVTSGGWTISFKRA
jgi:hypothetical protein